MINIISSIEYEYSRGDSIIIDKANIYELCKLCKSHFSSTYNWNVVPKLALL